MVSSQHQSDEIDLLVIGPQGVVVIEVKHWDRTWIKKNQIQVEGEAEKLSNKVRRVATTARGRFEYGIALVLASQEAKDFDTSLFSAIANYLILRVIENDAKALARNVAPSDMERRRPLESNR